MEIDKDKQVHALEKAKSIISDAEKERENTRVEKGVQMLMQGKLDALYNDELVENLASYILNKYILDEKKEAKEVLEKLGESLCSPDVDIRERTLMIFSVFSEIIIEEDFKEFQEILPGMLVEWLRNEDEFIAGFEFVCSQLEKIILEMLYNEQWQDLASHIHVLHQITTREIVKSNLIRGMTAKVHENLAEPDILDKLVTVYLDENDERREVAENLLIHFGRFSALFLVQKMIYCASKEGRFALIELIPRVGEVSVPVLIECLEDDPQWFVIRNIILIISRLEDAELYSVAEPYLTHNDIRIQQQVINCIERLGGSQMRKRLITALMQVNDDLKGQIIQQLAQFEDDDVGEAFLNLLENRKDIARNVQDDIVLKLCIRIKLFPSKRVIFCLRDLVQERQGRYGAKDRIVLEASSSLLALGAESEETALEPDEKHPAPPIDEAISAENLLAEVTEDQEETLFSSDEMDSFSIGADITESLAGSITQDDEDLLRKRGEKTTCQTSQDQHLIIWSKLYEQMSSDEADKFFTLLKPMNYQANEEIVVRGDSVTNMFFIDNGFAGLSYNGDQGEILLTSLQTGELIGSEGFIQDLKWTISLSTQTDLQVRILEQDSFRKLTKLFPDFSQKLQYYCNHYDVIPYLINLTEDNAKEPVGEDITVDGMSLFHDSSGSVIEDAVVGSLQYIARGGYCFTLPFVHPDNAQTILGRQVSSEVTLNDGSEKKCFGVIAGAGSHSQDDQVIFVYVKFYHPLNKADYRCSKLSIM
jgi:CRP-like cAMP-binding protein